MMHACSETTRPFGVKTMVSLNAIMVDGTGMCGSCRVTVGNKVRFACVEGPDFNAHEVDFDELIARQRRFKAQEAKANEDYTHVCNVERLLFEEEKRSYKKLTPKTVLRKRGLTKIKIREYDSTPIKEGARIASGEGRTGGIGGGPEVFGAAAPFAAPVVPPV